MSKRKQSSHDFQMPRKLSSSESTNNNGNNDSDFLSLSLAMYSPTPTPRSRKLSENQTHPQQPPLQISPQPPPAEAAQGGYPVCMPPLSRTVPSPDLSAQPIMHPAYQSAAGSSSRPTRARRNPSSEPREGGGGGKGTDTVPPPFPWATSHRATVHSLEYLVSKQMVKISGEVHCKRCDRQFEMEFDLREKFVEVGSFIAQNKSGMHDRAPGVWMNPVLPSCQMCEEENCVKPVIPEDKDAINWLFLLLGQLLGCCTLEQLKYFCKHTKNHRTGAKDRVLFLTYLGLCKQLDPNGPFDR